MNFIFPHITSAITGGELIWFAISRTLRIAIMAINALSRAYFAVRVNAHCYKPFDFIHLFALSNKSGGQYLSMASLAMPDSFLRLDINWSLAEISLKSSISRCIAFSIKLMLTFYNH